MNRPLLLFYTLILTMASCDTTSTTDKVQSEPGFIHTVFFWIKADADPILLTDFANGLDELATIEVIQASYYGPPAGTDRGVVDNSYGMSWIVHFANAADQDTYQNHPKHLAFIDKYQSLWDSVKVYDSLVK